MRLVQLIPVLTLALFCLLIFAEGVLKKRLFESRYEVPDTAPWWKRVIAKRNEQIRHGALFVFLVAANAFAMQVRRQPGHEWFLLLAIAGSGLLFYFVVAVLMSIMLKTDEAR